MIVDKITSSESSSTTDSSENEEIIRLIREEEVRTRVDNLETSFVTVFLQR